MNQNFTTPHFYGECHKVDLMVSPSAHAYASVLEGKAILLNLESGRYYSLNRTGTTLWEQLSGGCSLSTLLNSLGSKGRITQERAQQDLSIFLENLAHEGLIEHTRRA